MGTGELLGRVSMRDRELTVATAPQPDPNDAAEAAATAPPASLQRPTLIQMCIRDSADPGLPGITRTASPASLGL